MLKIMTFNSIGSSHRDLTRYFSNKKKPNDELVPVPFEPTSSPFKIKMVVTDAFDSWSEIVSKSSLAKEKLLLKVLFFR
jgi:hypothetical protein